MTYEKQGFYSGQKLQASQLDAMEDGIINAERLAMEAASQGAQADYNENDSASASYIKNRPFYEGYAFEPIAWDGVVGDKTTIDLSLIGAPSGTLSVKVSDQILGYEDFLDSVIITSDDQILTFTEDDLTSKEEAEQVGGYGSNRFAIASIFDTEKINTAFGINIPETGTGTYFMSASGIYIKSFSKTAIKKIDEKFLPELADASNMEKGAGEGSSQQIGDPSRVVDGKWDFNDSEGNPRNPNAADLRDENGNYLFIGMQDYGATGKYSGTFGGSNRASGARSFAINNRTIAAGDESFAQGYCTVAFGPSSFAGGSKTFTFEEAAVALGDSTIAGGKCSMAIGSSTIAAAQNAIATGDRTDAQGINSYAGGFQSIAAAHGAFVHGYNVSTQEEYGVVFGRNNIATEGANFIIGNGINENSNAFVSWMDGRASVYGAPKDDEDVIRQIDLLTAAENMMQFIDETYSNAPIHIGDGEHSVQQFDNFATNSHASAFGNATTASGENSFAQGSSNEASGYCSFVGGQQSRAVGNTSTAIGLNVQANYDRQVVVGQFNANKDNTIFEVGGGHADDNRLNVFEVYADGDIGIRFNGKTYSLQKMLASYFTDANLK